MADKSLKNKNKRMRQKIRRLAASEASNQINKCKYLLKIISLVMFSCALLLCYDFTQTNSNTKQLLKEFLLNYRNQYAEIVHGKSNYCDQQRQLDIETIFSHIKDSLILHQEEALQQIQLALRNERDINAIALMGPVGVGKTLFIRELQQHFPWPENVHTYLWNTYVEDEAKKFHLIRILIENLSECGQNLFVIENLQPCDHGAVALINQMLFASNKIQRKRIVLFYVFNLNTMLTPESYAVQKNLLQSLPDCQVINFKSFTHYELRDCIQREAEIENVALIKKDYDEIVETIDPLKSGCKNVNAKVLMYGKIKT